MIPIKILQYLDAHRIRRRIVPHPRALSAEALATMLGIAGPRLAKTVAIEADGRHWVAVLPAFGVLDPEKLRRATRAVRVRVLTQAEVEEAFPGCELGAEPPFGSVYGVPVIVDAATAQQDLIVVRAGAHDECLLMHYAQLAEVERPVVADIAAPAEDLVGRPAAPASGT